MTDILGWLPLGIVRALGWALIHSLWQGAVIAVLVLAAMTTLREPRLRYLVGMTGMALMLVAPVLTFLALLPAPVSAPALQSMAVASLPVAVMALPLSPLPAVMPVLVMAWLVGVALFSLRLAGGFVLLERRRGHCKPVSARFLALCAEVQDRLGLQHTVRFLECDWLDAPAAIGILRPIVLLPVTTLLGLSEDQLRAVIAHELAHVRRLDVLANLLQTVAEALLFYHPAVWWLGRRIRAEREHCCDKVAVSLYGNRLEYARALGLMQQWRAAPHLAMAANHGELGERILFVLGRESAVYRPQPLGVIAGMLLLMAALLVSQMMPTRMAYHLKADAALGTLLPPPVLQEIKAPVAVMPVIARAERVVVSGGPRALQPESHLVQAANLPAPADTTPDASVPVIGQEPGPPAAASAGISDPPMVCVREEQSASRLLAPQRCFTHAQWQAMQHDAARSLTRQGQADLGAEVHFPMDGE